jgi:radical SAM superfamily enzyme YgiQ (UPF0313 family)
VKIVLVQPYYFNIWESIGLGYIGAYLKANYQGELKIEFFQGYFDSHEDILSATKNADLLAISCTSPVYEEALSIAKKTKALNPNIRTVFGGWHPTALPHECLSEACIDQVVVGEGEKAFLQIINGEQSEIIYGSPFDLNSVFPDRELIKNNRTIDLAERMIGKRVTSVQSIRVCPFVCTFCSERNITGRFHKTNNPLRERDPKHIIEELRWLKATYNLNYFKFVDATWNTSTRKVIEFCEEKIRSGLKIEWEANVHCSFVSEEMLKIMKRANCNQINAGVESGSQKILKNMKKGLKLESIRDTFSWSKKLGLERRGYFIMGFPDETEADLQLTEKLVEEIQPDEFGITILCPYPGTSHYDPEKMRNLRWGLMDEYSNPYWSTRYFSNDELKEKQKYLMEKFSNLRSPIRDAADGSTIVEIEEKEINAGYMAFRPTITQS